MKYNEIEQEEDAKRFIFAGKAIFTLVNEATGNRYTYKFRKPNHKNGFWFVSLLTGSDNTHNFTYLGSVGFDRRFRLTRASNMNQKSLPVVAITWLLDRLNSERPLPEKVRVYHMSKCGKCGRPLTTPESIRSGFGPTCASLMR